MMTPNSGKRKSGVKGEQGAGNREQGIGSRE
jgi:hypothetical protein